MAGYDLYFGKMLFPIAPSKITTKINGKNKVYELINEGEMNILKYAGLTTMSFEVTLPAVMYPFATYLEGFQPPAYYLNELERLKQSRKPFQFILGRHSAMKARETLHDTNMTCSIEDYQIKDDAKEGFDTVVEIHLKQYKEYLTKTFGVELPSPNAPIAIEPPRPESTDPPEDDGGGWTGGDSGDKQHSKRYKVEIPGMGPVTVWGTSTESAIRNAAGKNWSGTIYVDGKSVQTQKGKVVKNTKKK